MPNSKLPSPLKQYLDRIGEAGCIEISELLKAIHASDNLQPTIDVKTLRQWAGPRQSGRTDKLNAVLNLLEQLRNPNSNGLSAHASVTAFTKRPSKPVLVKTPPPEVLTDHVPQLAHQRSTPYFPNSEHGYDGAISKFSEAFNETKASNQPFRLRHLGTTGTRLCELLNIHGRKQPHPIENLVAIHLLTYEVDDLSFAQSKQWVKGEACQYLQAAVTKLKTFINACREQQDQPPTPPGGHFLAHAWHGRPAFWATELQILSSDSKTFETHCIVFGAWFQDESGDATLDADGHFIPPGQHRLHDWKSHIQKAFDKSRPQPTGWPEARVFPPVSVPPSTNEATLLGMKPYNSIERSQEDPPVHAQTSEASPLPPAVPPDAKPLSKPTR